MAEKKVPPEVKLAIIKGVKPAPRVDEVIQHFFHLAGGPRSVAKLLFDEFNNLKPGSLGRQRILTIIMQATTKLPHRGDDDLGMLSELDLARRLDETLEGLVVDGTQTPATG